MLAKITKHTHKQIEMPESSVAHSEITAHCCLVYDSNFTLITSYKDEKMVCFVRVLSSDTISLDALLVSSVVKKELS